MLSERNKNKEKKYAFRNEFTAATFLFSPLSESAQFKNRHNSETTSYTKSYSDKPRTDRKEPLEHVDKIDVSKDKMKEVRVEEEEEKQYNTTKVQQEKDERRTEK